MVAQMVCSQLWESDHVLPRKDRLQPKSLHRDQQITNFVLILVFSEPSISLGAELLSNQPITERVRESSAPKNDGRIRKDQNLTDVEGRDAVNFKMQVR